ncbi:hypothetical protein PFICI_03358 [Pestalotiopsis fici W106-1]|uniref:FAD/NAD(P)-binding domain-containing protein n=1 Tax=Pestalotiopsis fici (strain W106-1 / CGMCC3.15140) TaxID=1229662 RepID=W3XGW8_PESFW|nr:uncharacterized protein PFICI_03358 [Pestalotiopsis fici W106-1]ETS85333.1 hypothetical protein PFICI_03358 [Pestalotiopsis fici W106-1]
MATTNEADAQFAQQKYAEETAKRTRADGMAQYQQLQNSSEDRLRKLADDPWADHDALDKLPRVIKSEDRVKFLIVGAGMGGIVNAVKLIKAGLPADQIRIVESAGGIGGTWYWNRYPGLHCDIESYVYLPLLEDTGYMPRQKYVSGAEIRSYLVSLAKKYGLDDKIMYRAEVNGLQWSDDQRAWRVDMTVGHGQGGQEKSHLWANAEFIFFATGLFPMPQVPKFPGLSGFQGSMFHTARWDYETTGGSSEEPFPALEKLKGKRVGIIGTGATAIQVVPQVAKYAADLYVFQRTPSQVNTRDQRDTDPEEWRSKIAAKKGWQAYRMDNFATHLAKGAPDDHENLVGDAWTNLKTYCTMIGGDHFETITPDKVPEHIGRLLAIDAEQTANVRARVARVVKDQDTAKKLTPWYPTWCKRPTFSDLYLETFNQENVHLIDTDGKGVESVTAGGVLANGQEYSVDVLILSTGYRSPAAGAGDPSARAGITIVGRNGRSFTEKWASVGASTLHGYASNGFPNFFWFGPHQTGGTANFAHNIDLMTTHIAYIVGQAHERVRGTDQDRVVVEVSQEAEEAWSMRMAQSAAAFAGNGVCGPSYLNGEGEALRVQDPVSMLKKARGSIWPTGIVGFAHELEAWRAEGKLQGIDVSVL